MLTSFSWFWSWDSSKGLWRTWWFYLARSISRTIYCVGLCAHWLLDLNWIFLVCIGIVISLMVSEFSWSGCFGYFFLLEAKECVGVSLFISSDFLTTFPLHQSFAGCWQWHLLCSWLCNGHLNLRWDRASWNLITTMLCLERSLHVMCVMFTQILVLFTQIRVRIWFCSHRS